MLLPTKMSSLKRCIRIKKSHFLILTIIFLIIMMLSLETRNTFLAQARLKIFGNEIGCYRYKNLETLPDVSEVLDIPENSIFFHETSCNSKIAGRIVLTSRQACAVESAALLHPNRRVYLLFTSPGIINFDLEEDTSNLAIKSLQFYDNIVLKHLNFAKYLNNTPLEHLYSSGSIELSMYAGSHASDILRYLSLWKFGGTYLDLDVVLTKSLDPIGKNYAGSESNENVAAGIMGLSSKGIGHKYAEKCLKDLSTNFSGKEWGYNGPGVITRLLRSLCGVQKAMEMTEETCGPDFKVMNPLAFYPIPWWNWTMYFDEKDAEQTLNIVKESYAIHVWNKHSKDAEVSKNSAYGKIAKKFCPRVFKAMDGRGF